MKLWLLRPIAGHGLWEPWYDKAFGFVVRAETEKEARAIAQANGGDETRGDVGYERSVPVWTDPIHSTCVELTADGEEGLVIMDFAAA